MVVISKVQKQLLKWGLVLAVIGIIVYTFRDSAGPILEQLKKTSPTVVIGICLMATVYQIIEGIITTVLARQYRSSFAYKKGITNAFLCSFYRVATLGSGSGVAAIIYLGEQGIEYGEGFGLYMIQYALHKISIALFSAILFVMNWEFMKSWFGDYAELFILLFEPVSSSDLPAA